MNRELKFRAIANIGGYWNKISSDEFSNLSQFFAEVLEMKKKATGNVFVRQFIGLLDSNKKEIYEGDIVKVGLEIRKIDWIGTGFWAVDVSGTGKDIESNVKKFKVIGNEIENPKLLSPNLISRSIANVFKIINKGWQN